MEIISISVTKKNSKVSIIIPARNEEKSIEKTILSLKSNLKIPYRLLIINDQSTDQTAEIVKNLIKSDKNIALINTSSNRGGFANALSLGFQKSPDEFVLPVMADLCDDPKTIDKMYQKMLEGFDIVAGSRYIKDGGKIGGPRLQGFLSEFVCKSLKIITGVPTTDLSNSFKIYRKSILNKTRLDPTKGVEISMDLTLQVYFKGGKITEVPTYWKGRKMGKSKFKILERFPRYLKIYIWAISQRLQKLI